MSEEYEQQRQRMVAEQISRRGLNEPRLLSAMRTVPRHLFVPPEYRLSAYADGPLPIGFGQTISQPYIVALMTHLLQLQGDERVLEVGTGSGYQAAILGKLAHEVHTIEFLPELAESAAQLLSTLGMENVHVHVGDGSLGWPSNAPYAGILVAAAAPQAPQALLEQLAEGGRLVVPVGGQGFQELEVWERKGNRYQSNSVLSVAFVPLRGQQGWDRKD
ncbi:MAG: protein-L-isoaspartate(D-aspartate) O-methyltransferase [Anaerolineales bacterium]